MDRYRMTYHAQCEACLFLCINLIDENMMPPLPFELFHENYVNIMAIGSLIRCIAMQVTSSHVIDSLK